MANPVTPTDRRRLVSSAYLDLDTFTMRARRQDEERRIREDDEYFRRTGENRSPLPQNSPLVEDDIPDTLVPRDIADDGDDYDEADNRHREILREYHSSEGDWAEDSPTRIHENPVRPSRVVDSQIRDIVASNSEPDFSRPVSPAERRAYLRREREKQESVDNKMAEKNRQKYNNSISGLEVDDEE